MGWKSSGRHPKSKMQLGRTHFCLSHLQMYSKVKIHIWKLRRWIGRVPGGNKSPKKCIQNFQQISWKIYWYVNETIPRSATKKDNKVFIRFGEFFLNILVRTLITSKNSNDNISKMNIKRLYVDLTRVKDSFCAMVDTNCDNSQ